MRELRCEGNKLHGLVVDEDGVKAVGIIEFRCDSKFCGKKPGCVVLHRFDLSTAECTTHRYSEPPHPTERSAHGARREHPSVRVPGHQAPTHQ